MRKYCLIVVLSCTALAGCAHKFAEFTVVSNDRGLAIGSPVQSQPLHEVKGEACRTVIAGFPSAPRATIDNAIADALAKAPGANALANARLESYVLFLLLYARVCYSVTGTPLSLPVR